MGLVVESAVEEPGSRSGSDGSLRKGPALDLLISEGARDTPAFNAPLTKARPRLAALLPQSSLPSLVCPSTSRLACIRSCEGTPASFDTVTKAACRSQHCDESVRTDHFTTQLRGTLLIREF